MAKIHMNVKCHCRAPPSQPPSVTACGTASIRSCSGILEPKLGNALKIRSPLSVSTVTATAFDQWQKRTAQGCSNAGRGCVSIDGTLESSVPAVALISPVAAFSRQDVGDGKRQQVLRLLVSEFRRQLQSQGGAVSSIRRRALNSLADQDLWRCVGAHIAGPVHV